MGKNNIFKNKYYTHLDVKKNYQYYLKDIKKPEWIKSHGFYPFIHYKIKYNKYIYNKEDNKRSIKIKERDIYYSAHIDRFIYEYYGDLINHEYNKFAISLGINKVATAYRNNYLGKCNIHFAKEALEFIAKSRSAFVFIGDFSSFFDNLDHRYLEKSLMEVLGVSKLDRDYYAVFKSLTKFSYVEKKDIEQYTGKTFKDFRKEQKIFKTKEFREFKKEHLSKNTNNYGIPQGSSMSSVLSNVYMIEFDKRLNDYVTSNNGLYRRYCDDIIVIIPINEKGISNGKYKKYINKIQEVRDDIPNLTLNIEKTEQFYYNSKNLINLKDGKGIIDYLGFSFDGEFIRIREKSLFKYYSRAYKKVKTLKRNLGTKEEYAIRKSLYRLYTHLGDNKFKKGYGNFITYARKSHDIFAQSEYLNSKINNQIKRHWEKINKRINN